MTRTQVLQEIRRMRFEEAYGGWQERRLTQEEAARRRTSPVPPSVPSASAERKAATKRIREGHCVHHFRGLLDHLATLTRNTVEVHGSDHPFEQLTVPTELQRTAFGLLEVKLAV